MSELALNCNQSVNYGEVSAVPRVPFLFTLQSVTTPEAGRQLFCYTVAGVGEDTSADRDLSHFVLGACPDLTLSDILSAQVIINGVEQDVVLGGNVTVLAPDPSTGCSGIKFDFGLNKVSGQMSVCFLLGRVFGVGPVSVCVKGGTQVLSSLSICGPSCDLPACETTVRQRTTVCVPVTVTPYALVGEITSRCCGAPIITPGVAACAARASTSCTFTVSQELCLSVPVTFGAEASVGTATTQCGTPTADDVCADCGAEAAEANAARLIEEKAAPMGEGFTLLPRQR